MPVYSQENRSVSIGTVFGDDTLVIKSMKGTEQLGRLYQFSLVLLSENPDIEFDEIIGTNATIRLETGNEPRLFNGFISRFSLSGFEGGFTARYTATLVPWTWFLTRVSDCRIFQNMSVPDIIKEIIGDYGFSDIKDKLSGSYKPWEYCVQYRETAFNFISRLMEKEGIYYYFEHEDGKHIMVLADGPSSHETCCDPVPFRPREAGTKTGNHVVNEWMVEKQVLPGAFAHRDFNFQKPKSTLESAHNIPREHPMADFEIYDYPGEFMESGDGDKYASIRMQELQSAYNVSRGGGLTRFLLPGGKFELSDFPREDQNREYLLTQIQHQIVADDYTPGKVSYTPVYQCTFRAIPSDSQFRSLRSTAQPQISGPQTAMVTGPSGEEIHTDPHGRVKVQFHWDRDGSYNENSSCWVRVSQNWAGKKWGAFFLPRVGQEVIVEFLEGDPGRPIITGRVYNGENKPPYDLPSEKTKSTIKSNSSKGGGGFNEIRFEDKKDEEQLFIHAQKNMDVRVLNDHYELVKNDQHYIVENDQRTHVQNNRSETVDQDHMEEIGKDRHVKVAGKEAKEVGDSLSLTVKGDMIEVFKSNHSEETTGNYYLKSAGTVVIESMQGVTIKCGGSAVVVDQGGVTIKGTGTVTLDGPLVNINSGPGSPAGSGSAGSAVSPTAPDVPEEADEADPGEVAEIKEQQKIQRKGKYGSVPVKPFKQKKDDEDEDKEKSWIEIELVDEDGNPIPGEKYKIELPDGRVATGTLDGNGFARVEGFDPGECKVTFPNLDKEAWEKS